MIYTPLLGDVSLCQYYRIGLQMLCNSYNFSKNFWYFLHTDVFLDICDENVSACEHVYKLCNIYVYLFQTFSVFFVSSPSIRDEKCTREGNHNFSYRGIISDQKHILDEEHTYYKILLTKPLDRCCLNNYSPFDHEFPQLKSHF